MLKEIAGIVGFDALDFKSNGIKVKETPAGVDVEVDANILYGDLKVNIVSKINPGSMHREEAAVMFKDGTRLHTSKTQQEYLWMNSMEAQGESKVL